MRVKVTKNDVPKLTKAGLKAVEKTVTGAAFAIESKAKVRAPYVTGFLKNSIQATPPRWDGGSTVEALVNVGAEYGIYVEFGHHGGAGKPYLVPAVEQVRPQVVSKMKIIMRREMS